MKSDDFERKLKQQPMRELPDTWRAEILAAARADDARRPGRDLATRGWFFALNRKLSDLLWPSPKAWGSLAALWVLIFGLHFTTREQSPVIAQHYAPISPQVRTALREQHRLFAELIGRTETRDGDLGRPKGSRPHSQGAQLFFKT